MPMLHFNGYGTFLKREALPPARGFKRWIVAAPPWLGPFFPQSLAGSLANKLMDPERLLSST
jgi:hypothetical protein